jgi:hypothetical protein
MSGTIDPRHTYDEYLVLLAKSGKTNEEDKVECVMRQTQRSHMVAPPIAPTWEEDRVLIKPLGDK